MATEGSAVSAEDARRGGVRRRNAALSAELIAILAVGVTLAGVTLTMLGVVRDEVRVVRDEVRVVRDEVRVIRDGQINLRERMARVESKVDVLAGDWPPRGNEGPAE